MESVKSLREMAKSRGITGYSKMGKSELISLLGVSELHTKSVGELKGMAKSRGLTGYSKMRKNELISLTVCKV